MGDDTDMLEFNKEAGVTNLEIDSIVKRIMALPIKDIDLLWKEAGWVDSEAKDDGNKALPNWRLDNIKFDEKIAKQSFINFITDEPYQTLRTAAIFLQELSKIENKGKKQNE